jgi:hypothetical protein
LELGAVTGAVPLALLSVGAGKSAVDCVGRGADVPSALGLRLQLHRQSHTFLYPTVGLD